MLPSRAKVRFIATDLDSEAEEAGVFAPEATPVRALEAGEVGYLVTGLKDVHQVKVGDTVTLAGKHGATEPLPGLPRAEADGVERAVSRPREATTRSSARRSTG